MAIDTKKVLVGAPDQSATTGAVNYAPTTATAPTDAASALAGFTSCGYVSEDGLTVSTEYSTTQIRDWSRSVVRTLLDEFTGTVMFADPSKFVAVPVALLPTLMVRAVLSLVADTALSEAPSAPMFAGVRFTSPVR